ncbi:MAG: 50S ribosomal protein L13 [Candidatus Zambryskibacteria bacterium RIFCSPHIGHO2_01_FULL_43_27]|nr:MAG: 50S ribosomal protein L13 [Candidatus Zambryskibacteria bacterium RIFCSPHIGHO2_01_FULL_43_27]OHB00334.1 MAG: 50S ribosomal protein L13 [Candidatus Zambryskibacteria bacterium RIFCSPHIGHO2_12_FULL_43_12b]
MPAQYLRLSLYKTTMQYEINAEGKKIGRVASEAASILMGKNSVSFSRNKAPTVEVVIINASALSISEKKKGEKTYSRHTGYPGGIKHEKLEEMLAKKGIKEVMRKTVMGMLPKNKLRAVMIKNLKVVE